MRLLPADLVELVCARYPVPIADATRALLAADGLHEQRDRVVECFRATVRTVAAVALAARAGAGARARGCARGLEPLLAARQGRPITDGQWIGLARAALAPWAGCPAASPVPELVLLFHGRRRRRLARALDSLLAMRRTETVAHGATGDDPELRAILARRLPALIAALRALAPVWDRLRLVVPLDPRRGGQRALLLAGDTPIRDRWRRVELAAGLVLDPGTVHAVDPDGAPLFAMAPFARITAVADSAGARGLALALFDGVDRRGARYLELPQARASWIDPAPVVGTLARLIGPDLPAAPRRARRAAPVVAIAAAVAFVATAGVALRGHLAAGGAAAVAAAPAPSPAPPADREADARAALADAARLLDRDPTAAFARLATIPAGSRAQPAARVLAADAARRGVARRVLRAAGSWIGALAVAPAGDVAVTGSRDGAVQLWSVDGDGGEALPGHDGAVLSVAISANGRWVASGGADATVRLWDRERRAGRALLGHRGWVEALAFSPDGRWLVSGGADGQVRLWPVDAPGEQPRVLLGHRGAVTGVGMARDDTLVVSTGADRTVRTWSLPRGRARVLSGHRAAITHMLLAGDRLVTADRAGEIRVWSLAAGREPNGRRAAARGAAITALAPAGEAAVLVGDDRGRAARVELGSGRVRELVRGSVAVSAVAESADGVAIGFSDGAIRLARGGVLLGHRDTVRALAPAGSLLVSAGGGGGVRVWAPLPRDRVTRSRRGAVTDVGGERPVRAGKAVAARSGELVVRGDDDGRVVARAAGSGRLVWSARLSGPVTWIGASADGTRFAATSWDGDVAAWDRGGHPLMPVASLGDVATRGAFSPSGAMLAVVGWGGRAFAVDLEHDVRALGHLGDVALDDVAFSPAGDRLAVAGDDGIVRLVAVAGQRLIACARLPAQASAITRVAFTADGGAVVAGTRDGSVSVIEPGSGQTLLLRAAVGAVTALAVGATGIISGHGDGAVVRWAAALPVDPQAGVARSPRG